MTKHPCGYFVSVTYLSGPPPIEVDAGAVPAEKETHCRHAKVSDTDSNAPE